jgi:hypothetical protein
MKPPWRNIRCHRIRFAAAARAVLIMGVLAAGPVHATYVSYATYMRIHGDWSVQCGYDEPTGRQWCDLKAPPPALGVTRSTIQIQGVGQGGHVVKVRIGHPISPESPVYLRVDANAPHQALPSRTGEAEWSGDEAATILREFGAGRRVAVRSFVGSPAKSRDEWYSLELFNQALLDYRAKTGS